MTRPACSVVIPCHNHARFLDSAIRSALGQRGASIELIVVNDGSTDTTAAVASAHSSVRLIHQPNRGLSAARNTGLGAATAEWVVFLDADDMLLPDAIATGLDLLSKNRDALMFAGRSLLIDADGAELLAHWAPPVTSDHYETLLSTNFIWTPGAAVMRRSAVVEAGGFAPDHSAAADYALYLRLARLGDIVCHDRCVVMYRQHGDSMSQDPVEMLRATLGVLQAERPFVPQALRPRFHAGVRVWKDYYGDQIAASLRGSLRNGESRVHAGRLALALLRYHPRGFLRHLARHFAVAAGIRRAEPSPPEKSRAPTRARPAGSEDAKQTQPSTASR